MSDFFNTALNRPPGRLAEILLKKLTIGPGTNEIPDGIRARLDKLVDAPGTPGKLARVRLAAEVSYLFAHAPEWTKAKILPLFDWSSADARDAWGARKYASYVGSPELFTHMKKPFLDIFGRTDVPSEDLRIFADWLTAILVANKSRTKEPYPIAPREACAALRRAGVDILPSVAHRLAIEMESAKSDNKTERWRNIVGPVFSEIWPLDVDLQSHASTYKLTQILLTAGDAFPEAVEVILPLIRPEDPRARPTVFSIAEAPDELYALSSSKMLELIGAVVGEAAPGSIFSLGKALSKLRQHDPNVANVRKFQRLLSYAAA